MAKKTEFFGFYATPEQAELIRKKAEESGLRMSAYLLKCALGAEVSSAIERQQFKVLLTELSRQGVNLNQCTKKMNQGEKQLPDFRALCQVWREVKECLLQKV